MRLEIYTLFAIIVQRLAPSISRPDRIEAPSPIPFVVPYVVKSYI